MSATAPPPHARIVREVRMALHEDLGSQTRPLENWVPSGQGNAKIICRQKAVIAGIAWCDTVFGILGKNTSCIWHVADGDTVEAGTYIAEVTSSHKAMLLGERTALNFLQFLSGIATITHGYVQTAGTTVKILDTRKTIPGLRLSQKYAVRCGGGYNHRMGIYDQIIVKENHIHACGGLEQAFTRATQTGKKVILEVENIKQLRLALALGADSILLDNFSIRQLRQAVAITNGQAILEASGGVNMRNIAKIAATGVNRVSVGLLTRDIKSVDFSMLHARQ